VSAENAEPCSSATSASTDSEESSNETPSKSSAQSAEKLTSGPYKTPIERHPELVALLYIVMSYWVIHSMWFSE
jgi:hypothetical protein